MNSLCALAADWRGDIPDGGLMREEKLDGFRMLRFQGIDGTARCWTRNGMPYSAVGHIERRLARMEEAAGAAYVFDGEFVVGGTLAETKAWAERGWKVTPEQGTLHLFDCLPFAEWQRGGTDQPLYERKAYLARLFAETEGSRGGEGATPVQIVADGWAFDAGDVLDAARRVWAAGGEGLMLKAAESPYRRTRCDAWQKVKPGGPWWRKARAEAMAA